MLHISPFKHGKVKEFSNQYIETEFILYFIPLNSYFVRQSETGTIQMTIPLNKISLKSYYMPLFLIFGPIVLAVVLVTVMSSFSLQQKLPLFILYVPFLILLLCIAYGIYVLVTYGKSESYEKKRRTVLEIAIGINALPEWLARDERMNILNALKATLPPDWKQLVISKDFDSTLYYKLYAAIYYEKEIELNAETDKLFIELDKRINKELYR